MNEMYDMSIIAHYYGVIGILGVVFLNVIMLRNARDVFKYQRLMSIFTPLGSMALGAIIFTGIIMMAAKHLEFSVENILMILFSLIIILLEVKRIKTLKYLQTDFLVYKKMAYKVLVLEVLVTLSISIWMWL